MGMGGFRNLKNYSHYWTKRSIKTQKVLKPRPKFTLEIKDGKEKKRGQNHALLPFKASPPMSQP
jgi:hypothetical protein